QVLVTGFFSHWSSRTNLYAGYIGSGNNLVVSSSGSVHSATGYIGYDAMATSNSVVITGSGSVWDKLVTLYVGLSGAGNRMVISNGGQVISQFPPIGYSCIGCNSSSSNNSV